MSIGKRLKELRESQGWTQADVAEKTGLRPGTISDIENDKSNAQVSTVRALAEVYESRVADLFGEPTTFELPLVGVVSAGKGANESYPTGHMLEVHTLFPAGSVAMLVRGDSMLADNIAPGDHVIVRQNPEPHPGERVVAWLAESDDCVVKKLRIKAGKRLLESANNGKPRYEPIELTSRDIVFGVLVGLIRKY